MATSEYEAPQVSELGSLQELTLQFNKQGLALDQFSQIPNLVGSLINP